MSCDAGPEPQQLDADHGPAAAGPTCTGSDSAGDAPPAPAGPPPDDPPQPDGEPPAGEPAPPPPPPPSSAAEGGAHEQPRDGEQGPAELPEGLRAILAQLSTWQVQFQDGGEEALSTQQLAALIMEGSSDDDDDDDTGGERDGCAPPPRAPLLPPPHPLPLRARRPTEHVCVPTGRAGGTGSTSPRSRRPPPTCARTSKGRHSTASRRS